MKEERKQAVQRLDEEALDKIAGGINLTLRPDRNLRICEKCGQKRDCMKTSAGMICMACCERLRKEGVIVII